MQVDKLKETVKQAAAEGAIVTHIKAKAADLNVLTEDLKNMTTAIIIDPVADTIEVLVPVQVRQAKATTPTRLPTAGPADSPEEAGSGGLDTGVAAGAAVGGIVGALVVGAIMWTMFKPVPPKPAPEMEVASVVAVDLAPVQNTKIEAKLGNY